MKQSNTKVSSRS